MSVRAMRPLDRDQMDLIWRKCRKKMMMTGLTTGLTRAQAGAFGRRDDGAKAMNDLPAGAPRDGSSPLERFKGAAPMAAAGFAIVAGLMAVSLTSPNTTTPSGEASVAAQPPPPGSVAPGVAFDQTPGAAPPAMAAELVVKFKDDAKVKDIVDAFWRDPAAARTRFDTFRAGRAEFAGLKLERVTYSNELVLVDTDGAARLPAMREIAARLSAHPDIAYAEPNMTAQPGAR